jgi:hypothetical protein
MKSILVVSALLLSSAAFAQDASVPEPKCDPIGRTSKGDLVYSILCRNIPGLAPGINGYNPLPVVKTIPIKPDAVPPPESK